MREIYRTVKMDIDGKETTFRVAKLDAFSGAQLLQLVRRYLPKAERGQKVGDLVEPIFMALKGEELKGLMVSCMNHTEIQLEAGWHPVMRGEDWGWPEIEHDTGICLKLVLECVLWSLDSFFGGVGSK